MRLRLAALTLVVLVLPLSAAAAARLQVVFHPSGHTPRVNQKWPWSIQVTSRGKPVAGTVTAQVVDPVGGLHAVELGASATKFVTNLRFRGRFADYVVYPPISRGLRITFRVTVKTALGKRVINYWIQAK